ADSATILRAPAGVYIGDLVTLVVKVSPVAPGSGVPTGSVTIRDARGQSCTAVLTNGVGTCALRWTSGTSAIVTPTYSGDANFNAAGRAAGHPCHRPGGGARARAGAAAPAQPHPPDDARRAAGGAIAGHARATADGCRTAAARNDHGPGSCRWHIRLVINEP